MMFKQLLIAALALVSLAVATRDLSSSEFKSELQKDSATFVKFFAPWCGHCKRLAPTIDDLSKHYDSNSKIDVVKVDCTKSDNRAVCAEQGVRGYPTLKMFKAGDAEGEKYEGARSLDAMKSFIDARL